MLPWRRRRQSTEERCPLARRQFGRIRRRLKRLPVVRLKGRLWQKLLLHVMLRWRRRRQSTEERCPLLARKRLGRIRRLLTLVPAVRLEGRLRLRLPLEAPLIWRRLLEQGQLHVMPL